MARSSQVGEAKCSSLPVQEPGAACSFRYLAVEPSPGSAGDLSPGSTPSTPLARRRSSGGGFGADADATSTASGGSGSWPGLRGRSGREQRREEKERLGRSGRRQQRGEAEQLDLAPEAAYSRRQRWMRDPPVSASPITPPDSDSEGVSGDEGDGSGTPRGRGSRGGRSGRSGGGGGDHHMSYLLRRQLKVGRLGWERCDGQDAVARSDRGPGTTKGFPRLQHAAGLPWLPTGV